MFSFGRNKVQKHPYKRRKLLKMEWGAKICDMFFPSIPKHAVFELKLEKILNREDFVSFYDCAGFVLQYSLYKKGSYAFTL